MQLSEEGFQGKRSDMTSCNGLSTFLNSVFLYRHNNILLIGTGGGVGSLLRTETACAFSERICEY